jgi:hypothetical protein
VRLLEQPASSSRATACRNVEQSWRLLEDIERCLIALDLDFAEQVAIRELRAALIARLHSLAL